VTPVLGSTEQAILAVLAPSDGLTVAEIGTLLGRTARGLQRSVSSLDGKGCISALTERWSGTTPAKVWTATARGRAALEAHQQGDGNA
jgi:predicted ArsR family transcriptional regulator